MMRCKDANQKYDVLDKALDYIHKNQKKLYAPVYKGKSSEFHASVKTVQEEQVDLLVSNMRPLVRPDVPPPTPRNR